MEYRDRTEIVGSEKLMDLVIKALDDNTPFSVVSVGITEAFVLSQYTILKEEDFMSDKEVWVASQGLKRGFDHRGIRFPNKRARDEALESLFQADAVGYNIFLIQDELVAKVFQYYNFTPRYVFESHLRRVIMFSQQQKFLQMLSNRKVLIMCSYADEVKAAMNENLTKKIDCKISTIKIEEFEDIPRVKEELACHDFDLCLLAAGINAVILAPYIAQTYRKVAFDLGQGMESLISGKIEMVNYLKRFINLDELMKM
jgi:hypothetical protein